MERKNLKIKFLQYFAFILCISCVNAQKVESNLIEAAKNTGILKISNNNRFDRIPKEIFSLRNLNSFTFIGTECDISNKECVNIDEIPTDIIKLSNLKELYLIMNSIKSLPNELNYLQKLKVLDLSNNLDLDISNLKNQNLEVLNLNGCNIKKIPLNINSLKNLKVLGLEDNYDLDAGDIEKLKRDLPNCKIYWK